MNLCLVIDRSGSMEGVKLETSKKSCIDIFRRLNDGDLLTVVTFDDRADIIINPQTPAGEVEARLASVRSGGMTNLSLGWYQGLLELQTHMDGDLYHSRLLLLSDGLANSGETKRAVFSESAIRAREVGISASTVGVGADFQEDLLEAIASSSGGRFWNISDSDIEDIIEEEFQGALTVLLDRPRVILNVPNGVRVSRELNSLRKTAGGQYKLRPLQGEDTFNFAVRLEVDPSQVETDEILVSASLSDNERLLVSGQIPLGLGSPQEVATSPAHPLVRSIVQQFETATTDEVMLDNVEADKVAELKEMLTAEIAKLQTTRAEWEDIDPNRWEVSASRASLELGHLSHNVASKSILNECLAMVEPYVNDGDVQYFLTKVRKHMMREGQRMRMRRLSRTRWDEDAPIVLEAIALADELAARYPSDAERIHRLRERLRGYLEHD